MDGHIEPLSGILRIGGAYGEPYTWAAPLRYLSPSSVEVMASLRAPTIREAHAMRAVLAASGITEITFTRRHGTLRHAFRHAIRAIEE